MPKLKLEVNLVTAIGVPFLIPKPMYMRDWSACHQRLKFYGHSKIHCDNHNLFVFMSDI